MATSQLSRLEQPPGRRSDGRRPLPSGFDVVKRNGNFLSWCRSGRLLGGVVSVSEERLEGSGEPATPVPSSNGGEATEGSSYGVPPPVRITRDVERTWCDGVHDLVESVVRCVS